MTGPHSKIPKFTRSRPFGLPQTPFNPKSGKYLPFTKDPNILNVVVERKLTTADNMYLCSVLDGRTIKSGDQIHAQRLSYGSSIPAADITENTVLQAFKVDNKWWISTGDESELPTIDFCVDLFDRANLGNLGQYWNDYSEFRVYNEKAVYTYDANSWGAYQAHLSSHNYNVRLWYAMDADRLLYLWNENYTDPVWDGTNIHELFGVILGWSDEEEYSGLRVNCYIGVYKAFGPTEPVYLYHRIYVRHPGVDFMLSDKVEIWTTFSQAITSGSILININESVITATGNPFNGSYDFGAVYSDKVGLFTLDGNTTYPHQVDNFKAWVSSIPEPPNESGHGRYINGQFVYSDKYHAGGEYNPDA